MSPHTPGPWTADERTDSYVDINDTVGRWSALARVVVRVDGEPSREGQANARLIAAAPDLLQALQELLRQQAMTDKYEPLMAAQAAARAALAKALPPNPAEDAA